MLTDAQQQSIKALTENAQRVHGPLDVVTIERPGAVDVHMTNKNLQPVLMGVQRVTLHFMVNECGVARPYLCSTPACC